MNEQRPHDWPYCHGVKPRVDATDSGSVDTPELREILHDLCALWIGDNSEPKARPIAHIESLTAGVRKDAERYRWRAQGCVSAPISKAYISYDPPEWTDAAVDAAMVATLPQPAARKGAGSCD